MLTKQTYKTKQTRPTNVNIILISLFGKICIMYNNENNIV